MTNIRWRRTPIFVAFAVPRAQYSPRRGAFLLGDASRS
jgi:hypothetical protein